MEIESNPYAASSPDHPAVTEPILVPDPKAPSRRVWPSWVVLAGATFVYLFVSTVFWVIAAVFVAGGFDKLASSGDDKLVSGVLENPTTLALVLLPSQLALMAVAMVAAAFSSHGFKQRLGFVAGRWSIATGVLIAAATPFISLLTSMALRPFIQPSEHLELLTGAFRFQSEQGYLWLLILLVGFLPAICEEVLFRGYIQNGFARRWPAVIAVTVASLLFAAFHMDWTHALAVIPLGLWLGTLTTLSKSLWPAILGHLINNVASVLSVLPSGTDVFDMPPPVVTAAVFAFGVTGLGTLVWTQLRKKTPPVGTIAVALMALTFLITRDERACSADESESILKTTSASPTITALQSYLKTSPKDLNTALQHAFARNPLSVDESREALQMLVEYHQEAVRRDRRAEHDAKRIILGELEMPYFVREFGERPEQGHSLYLSMHGGGNTPKAVNDSQWRNQQRLYDLDEGIYVAPRAPTNTWNLWHEAHIDRFYTRLIENMIAFEAIDPNRVYITGYSAGGDGVYQLAPRMADHWAAAAMMAGHPNETKPLGLRNIPFTIHVGEKDAGYRRNELASQWKDQLAELHRQDDQGYVHWVKIHEGKGHWMDRDDAEGIKWLGQYKRNLIPNRVAWLQDDVLKDRFYWLSAQSENAKAGQVVIASYQGNRIEIDRSDVREITILLRDDMVKLDDPITIFRGQEKLFEGKAERTIERIVRTLIDRGDPAAIFTASVTVSL